MNTKAPYRGLLAAWMLCTAVAGAGAAPVSGHQALEAAYTWLAQSPDLMGEAHGQLAGTVTPVADSLGRTAFYVVDLLPVGYVVVAGEDIAEPVIAFSTSDAFTPAPGEPLYDMLRTDVPRRLARARAATAGPDRRWQALREAAAAPLVLAQSMRAMASSIASVSDMRVAPLVKTRWDQRTSFGLPVYNYFTPPGAPGNPGNYYTGCVATMLGQLMRYHQWPQGSVGTAAYPITVGHQQHQRALRGGDGSGGPYVWGSMPAVASAGMPAEQEQAISALLADAGVASNMDYESNASGAAIRASVLTNVFHYANAAWSQSQLATLETAIKANLDAGLPVGLGITGRGVGHAVVVDGYGYNGRTLYHHLNMGWSGADNAWYNLPSINVGVYDFTVVDGALFNIDPTMRGEILSGRILTSSSQPARGITVSLANGATVLTATTNSQGIYAVRGLNSGSTWMVSASGSSFAFTPASLSVTLGHSGGGVGDKTGVDFTVRALSGSVTATLTASAAANGAKWRVDGGPWLDSGASASPVAVGSHTVSFLAARGWTAPASQPVSVANDQMTSLDVSYTPQYSLSAQPGNASAGTVSANPAPGELNSYPQGSVVTLSATAAAGHYFGGWVESGTLAGMDSTYTCQVTGARTLVASFPPLSLTGSNTHYFVTSNRQKAEINVLANVSGGTTVTSVTQPANGSVTIGPDGSLAFTPGKSFRGSSTFSFTATDGAGNAITRAVVIDNWFASGAGTYTGLASPGPGYIKLTVTQSGAFSGKLTYHGLSYRLAGAFDSSAGFATSLPGSLGLTLRMGAGGAGISGVITGSATSASLAGQRAAAATPGKYTIALTNTAATAIFKVIVSKGGAISAAGRLASGAAVAFRACADGSGIAPFELTPQAQGPIDGSISLPATGSASLTGTYSEFAPATNNLIGTGIISSE